MNRLQNLRVFFGAKIKKLPKESKPTSTDCEVHRKEEWAKYSVAYHKLLSSNTFYGNKSSDILSVGFNDIHGEEFVYLKNLEILSGLTYNLDKLVYDCIVTRPKIIWLPCMDERLQYLTASHHALSLGMPGCECLMSEKEKEKIANEIVEICEKNPTIEEIVVSSHSGCGAVAKAIHDHENEKNWYTKLFERFENEDDLVDKVGCEYASSFAKILEEKLSQNSLSVTARTHHFARQELHSQHLHNAFGAVVNLDPLLNTAEFEDGLELPMFNIYSGGQIAKQIFDNISLAVSIASGDHGFGVSYLTKNSPFIILFTLNFQKDPKGVEIIKEVLGLMDAAALKLDVVYKVLDTSN